MFSKQAIPLIFVVTCSDFKSQYPSASE